jgi:lysosomal Pro-X carboxypeptidase
MFYAAPFDYDAYNAGCLKDYGIQPDYDYTLNHFGGITDKEYLTASNIVFTNGGLDPWSGASPLKDLSKSLVTCVIRKYALN